MENHISCIYLKKNGYKSFLKYSAHDGKGGN